MLIGYMRVSRADGSQTTDLQQDALLAADVDPSRLYEDLASGRLDSRPVLEAALKALRPGDTLVVWKLRLVMAAMAAPSTRVGDLCRELGICRQTLYRHVGPDGSLRKDGQRLLDSGK